VEAVDARKKRVAKKSYLLRAITLADRKQGQIGQTMPYRWQAHHILPMSSFTEFFSLDKLRIILMSNYDINHGLSAAVNNVEQQLNATENNQFRIIVEKGPQRLT
jgi:hypothetical protein